MTAKPELILGTAQLTTNYGITRPSNLVSTQGEALELLAAAHSLGIRTLDTAPAYGEAEAVIGRCKQPFNIHTKLESGRDELESITDTLIRLNVDEVDLLYIHDIDAFEHDPHITAQRLERCLQHGARAIAVSLYTIEQMEIALSIPSISAIQFPLNVLDRRFSGEVLRRAKNNGCRCIARSAFLQGVLLSSGRDLRPEVSHLQRAVTSFNAASNEVGLAPLTAALGWVASHEELDGVIIGISTTKELHEVHTAWIEATSLPADTIQTIADHTLEPDGVDPRKWGSQP